MRFFLVSIILVLFHKVSNGQQFIDSLGLDQTDLQNQAKVMAAYERFFACYQGVDANKMLLIAEDMVLYSKDKEELLPKAYNYVGTALQFNNLYDSAILFHQKAGGLSQELSDSMELGESLKLIGNAYYRLGALDSTILYYLEAQEIAEDAKETKVLAGLSHNLSLVYKRTKKFNESEKMLWKAIENYRLLGDSSYLVNSYISLANLKWEMDYEGMDSVEFYYQKALALYDPKKHQRYTFSLFDNLSLLYSKLGKPELSLKYSDKCTPYIPYITDYRTKARYYHQRSWAMALLKMPGAKELMDSNYYYASKSGNIQDISEASEGLFKHYYFHQNLDSGDFYYQVFIENRDSIYSLDALEAVATAEEKFENEKIVLENESLEQKLKNKKLKEYRMWLAIGLALLLALVVFLVYRARLSHLRLEKKKQEVLFQEKIVASNLKSQEEERAKIARELHDGLNQQITGIKIGLENLIQTVNTKMGIQVDKLNSLKDVVSDVSDEVRGISHQLIPSSLLKLGLSNAIRDLVEFYESLHAIKFSYDTTVTDTPFNEIQETHIYRVVQELISNIVKHSGAKQAEIQLYQNDKRLYLVVSDDGVGIPATIESVGIGIENIKSRVNLLNGSISFSNDTKGTVVNLSVPFGL